MTANSTDVQSEKYKANVCKNHDSILISKIDVCKADNDQTPPDNKTNEISFHYQFSNRY